MTNNRKYQNGQIITFSRPTALGFVKILIRRKEKSSKQNPEIRYLCNVYYKDGRFSSAWIIEEKDIDELIVKEENK